jgi:hypothetical protein
LLLARAGKLNPAAVMHGTNRDEGAMFTNSFPDTATNAELHAYLTEIYADKAEKAASYYTNQTFPSSTGVTTEYWVGMRQATDYFFGCPTREAGLQMVWCSVSWFLGFEHGGSLSRSAVGIHVFAPLEALPGVRPNIMILGRDVNCVETLKVREGGRDVYSYQFNHPTPTVGPFVSHSYELAYLWGFGPLVFGQ